MIKKIIILFIILSNFSFNLSAQDSSAYELQRAKINALLAERSAKFGQYDESLAARTGIFGFQTKRDIKNSNEILRQIAINDNNIFQELKVLMDYKDLQVEQAKTVSNTSSTSIQNYRRTIKDLQDQNQKLSDSIDKTEKSNDLAFLLMSIFIIACAILSYLLYHKMKKTKRDEKAIIQVIK